MLRARQRGQIDIVLLQRPQQRGERARGGLEQAGEIDVIGAETDAVFAQHRARGLVEILQLVGDLRTLEHAERLDELKGDAAGDAGDVLGLGELEHRPEQLLDMGLEPELEPRLHLVAGGAGQALVGDDADARMQRVLCGRQPRHGVAGPADDAFRGQHELVVRRVAEPFGAHVDLAGEHRLRCSLQGFRIGACFRSVRCKGEAVEAADDMAFDDDFAGLADFSIQARVLPQAAHQYTGPAINETLSQAFMERIR